LPTTASPIGDAGGTRTVRFVVVTIFARPDVAWSKSTNIGGGRMPVEPNVHVAMTIRRAKLPIVEGESDNRGASMRIILVVAFAIAAGGLMGAGKISAAPACGGAIGEAAAATSMVFQARCRVVRRCSYWGCSYEEVCS